MYSSEYHFWLYVLQDLRNRISSAEFSGGLTVSEELSLCHEMEIAQQNIDSIESDPSFFSEAEVDYL